MATTKQSQQDCPEPEKQSRRQRDIDIEKQVLRSLGQPTDLVRVVVRRLWEDRYRVNVFVGADVVDSIIQHSYFLVTDSAGHIVSSTPAIAKEYCPINS